jgi:hypothetical protein
MKSLALRVILVALLILTIADKVWRPRATPSDMGREVLSFAARNGWTAHQEAAATDSPLGSPITFRAESCDKPGQIYLVHLSLQAAPMLNHVIPPDYARRFVYLGRTWFIEDRWGMRLEWLKQRVLSLFGLARYTVNDTVLVITEPGGCHIADNVDWSLVWGPSMRSAYLPRSNL